MGIGKGFKLAVLVAASAALAKVLIDDNKEKVKAKEETEENKEV